MGRKPTIYIPQKRGQCCGKNQYANRQEAEKIAEEQMLLTGDLELSTYACTCGCGQWHLTRSTSSESNY